MTDRLTIITKSNILWQWKEMFRISVFLAFFSVFLRRTMKFEFYCLSLLSLTLGHDSCIVFLGNQKINQFYCKILASYYLNKLTSHFVFQDFQYYFHSISNNVGLISFLSILSCTVQCSEWSLFQKWCIITKEILVSNFSWIG